ncbi:MAG: hypothetical protein JWN62_1158 [Acidimicrobiales bacterium]|nr:hypothetical protein [Acidimicrobiales bacterium]
MPAESPRLRVGCAMWAHRAWVGPFYPPSTRSGEELAEYATWCTAVEGNTTFYAVPPADTVRRWADATPTSFRFLFKLPRTITHEHRLRGSDAEVTAFVRLMEPLGERLGPVSIQLPASFGPGDLGVLAAFLRRVPREAQWSLEVRNPAFFDHGRAHDWLDRLLADTGTERVIFDTTTLFSKPPTDDAERDGWGNKPRIPVVPAAVTDGPIVRFIGRTDPVETARGWQPWLPRLRDWLAEGRTPTMFVHTPDNVVALGLARRLHDAVRSLVPDLEPLPVQRRTTDTDEQQRLFDD